MSDGTRINWHQGLCLGSLKRRYRRFRDGHPSNSHGLKNEAYEPEDQCDYERDYWDYDHYWNPWDPGQYVVGYWEYLIRNLDTVVALNRLDPTEVLGQPTGIVLPGTDTRPEITTSHLIRRNNSLVSC